MDRYTKIILTVIAVALVGDFFKDTLITPVHADVLDRALLREIIGKIDQLISMH